MSALEIALSLVAGAVSGGGVWLWAQTHSHPEHVNRNELELLRAMIQSQHEALLRELELLRQDVSRNSRR